MAAKFRVVGDHPIPDHLRVLAAAKAISTEFNREFAKLRVMSREGSPWTHEQERICMLLAEAHTPLVRAGVLQFKTGERAQLFARANREAAEAREAERNA